MGKKEVHKKGKTIPKPGDKGYLTPTQLRNARKRRAKKQNNPRSAPESTVVTACATNDPSVQYASNPRLAPIVQQAVQFFKNKIGSFPVHVGATTGWRTVAKLAVRNISGALTIGLFEPGSHRLIAVPNCAAHHPAINWAVAMVQRVARNLNVMAFDETTGTGTLRHVAFSVERKTSSVQITLVWNDSQDNASKEELLLDRFCNSVIQEGTPSDQEGKFSLHSLWVHYNSSWKHANAIFSISEGRWTRRHGPELGTVEYLNGFPMQIPLYFPPTVFRQANLDAFGNIVLEIRQYLSQLKKKGRCVELYGGVGTIGLHLTDLCLSLRCSDENPHNLASFSKSLESLSPSCKDVLYESACATKMIGALGQADWIIVDPPRKGLDEAVVQALSSKQETSAKHLIYVSCGFDAFQRDYQVLTTKGGWRLDQAAGYILFPGSNAIETLAIFKR